jgi:hypothetical protein
MSEDDHRGGNRATGTESALWELALRLVPPQYGPSGQSAEPPHIWPGQLPNDLPFELPIPDDSRIVGSYGRGLHRAILIDSELHPKNVVAQYTDRLRASGWSMPEALRGPGGFVGSEQARRAQAIYCRSAQGPTISVVAEIGADTVTHVMISVNLDPADNPCGQPSEPRVAELQRVGPPLPPLEAPASSHLVSHGGGAGPDVSTALATLTVHLGLTPVVDHYIRQLEEAGWQLDEEGESGPVAWSAWSFAHWGGGLARGALVVLKVPGEISAYSLFLHAQSAVACGEQQGSGILC